jgi:hypothetical protein
MGLAANVSTCAFLAVLLDLLVVLVDPRTRHDRGLSERGGRAGGPGLSVPRRRTRPQRDPALYAAQLVRW